jgi:hypothetical protein
VGKKNSIKSKIVTSFMLTIVSIIGIIGYITFTGWKASIDTMIIKVGNDENKHIESEIETFLNLPVYIDEVGYNLLRNGLVDMQNEKERDIFFVGILKTNPDNVYSFSFGTENGEYYGARRNSENVIELMKSDEETDGNSMYYSITPDLTKGAFLKDYGKFDVRTREWYKSAKEK